MSFGAVIEPQHAVFALAPPHQAKICRGQKLGNGLRQRRENSIRSRLVVSPRHRKSAIFAANQLTVTLCLRQKLVQRPCIQTAVGLPRRYQHTGDLAQPPRGNQQRASSRRRRDPRRWQPRLNQFRPHPATAPRRHRSATHPPDRSPAARSCSAGPAPGGRPPARDRTPRTRMTEQGLSTAASRVFH